MQRSLSFQLSGWNLDEPVGYVVIGRLGKARDKINIIIGTETGSLNDTLCLILGAAQAAAPMVGHYDA